ncbi:MAG: PrgI family protein [bacterium]|nr:PrgI family protein [bacterium]
MQYQVPQFIETEDKIIGPLTLKQFIIACAGTFAIIILYLVFTTFLWIMVSAVIATVTVILAFVQYNGRPIISFIGSALNYFFRPRLFVWKRKEELAELRMKEAEKSSPLQRLLLNLTTGVGAIAGRSSSGTVRIPSGAEERFQVVKKATGEQRAVRRVDYR